MRRQTKYRVLLAVIVACTIFCVVLGWVLLSNMKVM